MNSVSEGRFLFLNLSWLVKRLVFSVVVGTGSLVVLSSGSLDTREGLGLNKLSSLSNLLV